MISSNEKEKIQFIFNKFKNTIANHVIYTVNHEPIFKQKLIEKYKTAENINTVLMTLNNLPNGGYYSDKDLFKVVDYNLKFKNKFMAKIEKINLDNNITFKYASTALTSIYGTGDFHPEAPFQINIFVKNKEVGAFNFIILNNTSNRKLLINLVQGKKGTSKQNLKSINDILGNWKHKIVENLVSIAKSIKAEPIGILPQRYKSPGISNQEYLRIVNTYLEAFLHSGIKPAHISFEKVDVKLMHEAQINFMKITDAKIKRNKVKNKAKTPLWKKHIK